MKHDIIITDSALKIIQSEAEKCPVETGGILVGLPADPIIIMDAGRPGNNAIHRATQFTSDPQADTECLNKNRKKYGNVVDPVGHYHKHPGCMKTPSGGDCLQIQKLQEQYNDQRPVIMGIVNLAPACLSSECSLYFYRLDHNSRIVELPWRAIDDHDEEITKAIQQLPMRPNVQSSQFWSDPGFHFYLNPIGRDRIQKELSLLRQDGWQTTTMRRKQDHVLVLDVFNGRGHIRFALAPEFPLNPPSVRTRQGKHFIGLYTVTNWNSNRTLVQVAREAVIVMNCRRCRLQVLK